MAMKAMKAMKATRRWKAGVLKAKADVQKAMKAKPKKSIKAMTAMQAKPKQAMKAMKAMKAKPKKAMKAMKATKANDKDENEEWVQVGTKGITEVLFKVWTENGKPRWKYYRLGHGIQQQ